MRTFCIAIAWCAIFTMPCLCQVMTTLEIEEVEGVTTSSCPVTFGHIFVQGDCFQSVVARINGTEMTTQTDVKVRYPDGSIRFAIISFRVPVLAAHSRIPVELIPSMVANNGSSLSADSVVAPGRAAGLRFVMYADSTMNVVTGTDTVWLHDEALSTEGRRTWLAGRECTEYLLNDTLLNPSASLNVSFHVRRYPAWPGTRIAVTVENCWHNKQGNVFYDVEMLGARTESDSVFIRTKVKHLHDSRWRRVFWSGLRIPRYNVRFDLDYLSATGMIPPYDKQLGVSPSIISALYQRWNSVQSNGGTKDILSWSIAEPAMPSGGGHADWGLVPGWVTTFLLSMDDRARQVSLGLAEQGGSYPYHLRFRDKNRVLLPSDVPGKSPFHWYPDYLLPYAKGDMHNFTPMSIDGEHPTEFAFVPYLITGDYYFLEEILYMANYCLFNYNFNGNTGIIKGAERQAAWAWRSLLYAAVCAVDSSEEQLFYRQKLSQNIEYAVNHINTIDSNNIFGFYHLPFQTQGDCFNGINTNAQLERIYSCLSPWQYNYIILVSDQIVRAGFDSARIWRDFMLRLPVGLVTNHPDYNKFDAAPYRLAPTITCPSCASGWRLPASWAELHDLNYGSTSGNAAWATPAAGHTYHTILHYVLTIAARCDIPNAKAGYDDLHAWMTSTGMDIFKNTDMPQWWIMLSDPRDSSGSGIENSMHSDDVILNASPNPFNPTVNIFVATQKRLSVTVRIYTVAGVMVTDLSSQVRAGKVQWNASSMASGIYMIHVQAGARVISRSAVLLK